MKKTFVAAAVAAGLMMLATGTSALAAESMMKTDKSDFVVMPGTGSDTLRLHFSGAERLHRDFPGGGLIVFQAGGGRMHYRPDAYQLINGKLKAVAVDFLIDGKDEATVQFGKIDKSAPVFLKRGAMMYNQPM